MIINLRYDGVEMPEYAMPYLINDDASGLSELDKQNIDEYMKPKYERAKDCGGHVIVVPEKAEPTAHFSWFPEFGLPCNVIDCIILIVC